MTPIVCGRCGREQLPHEDPAPLCPSCTGTLKRRARDTLQVILLLRDTQARLDRVEPDPTRGSGPDPSARTLDGRYPQTAAATRDPVGSWGAGDAIRDLRRTVEGWAQHLAVLVVPKLCRHESCHAGRRPWCQRADERAHAAAGLDRDAGRWLADRADHARRHPWAVDALADIERAHANALRLVDRPADLWFVGPCDATVDDDGLASPHGTATCGHDLYGRLDAPVVRCRYCGTDHDATARRDALLDAAGDVTLPAVDCARALTSLDYPVTPELIRQWRHRGILEAVGVTEADAEGRGGGRPTYRLRDVRAALTRHTYGTVRTA